MRIKKKNIREGLDSETTEKVDQVTDDATETIEKVASDFKEVGVAEPDNVEIAGTLVSDVLDGEDEMSGISEAVKPTMTKRELVETVLGKESRVVRPSMSKDELMETIGEKKNTTRKVIKTLKIKDLRK